MIVFNIFINLSESLLFSLFLSFYYDLDRKGLFIAISSCIQFIILEYATLLNNNELWLSIFIMLIMLLILCCWTKKILYDYFYIILLYESFMLLSAFLSIIITDVLENILLLYDITTLYILKCLLCKFIQGIITFSIIYSHRNLSTTFDFDKWSFILIYDLLTFSVITILICTNAVNFFNNTMINILLFLMIFTSFLFRYAIYRMNKLNKNVIEFGKIEEMTKYNDEKLAMIKCLKDEIDATDHRLFYMLMQMENYLKFEKYDELKILLNNYRDALTKNKFIINSGNSMFDCLFSLKINELIMEGINIETSIFISENKIYSDMYFINFINDLLDLFKECNKLFFNLYEMNGMLILKIVYRDGSVDSKILEDFFKNQISSVGIWNITNHETKGVRLSINLNS